MVRSALFSRFTAAVLVGAMVGTSVAPVAVAQGAKPAKAAKKPDRKTKAAARKAYTEGKTAFEEGKFEAAATGYGEANRLIPSPQAQYWVATSLDRAGKVLEAIAAYEALMADPGKDRAGADKLGTAGKRLEELKKTPGKVSLATTPPGAAVTVDSEPQKGETPMILELAPGKHTITVLADGYETQTVEVEIGPAGNADQAVELVAKPAEEPVPVVVAPPPPPEPEPKKKEERSMLPAYVTLGVAGAGLLVGGFFGFKAMGAKSDFDDDPTNEHADDVERNALIADMAFGVALTLGVTGLVLLTVGDDDDDSSGADGAKRKRRRSHAKASTLRLAPYVSPTGGGAAARWTF